MHCQVAQHEAHLQLVRTQTACVCMQPAETLKQRLDLIFQQKDKVTLGDLLSVVRGPDDLGSKEFESAVCKLIWKLDYKSQEYRELNDFLKRMDHYGSVTRQSLAHPRWRRCADFTTHLLLLACMALSLLVWLSTICRRGVPRAAKAGKED